MANFDDKTLGGDLFRLITLVERNSEKVHQIVKLIYPRIGKASAIGITGPPGIGKRA